MSNLNGRGKGEVTSPVEQQSTGSTARDVPRRFSQSRLRALAPLLVAIAVITFVLACLFLVDYRAATKNAPSNTSRVGNRVPGVNSEGFHARRRAMAGMALRRDQAFAAEEPAGFVFQQASTERENSLRAASLLAAAGAPVVVLDSADDVKETIRRCTQEDGCDPVNIFPEIRARIAGLVNGGLAQPSPSSADTVHSRVFSGVPADGVIGDETLDALISWTGRGETEIPGESGVAEKCCGNIDADQRAGMEELLSCPVTAASPGMVGERGAWRVHGEESNREIWGEDTPAYPDGGAVPCGTDGWGVDAGTESKRTQAGKLGVRAGTAEEDGFSIGQGLAPEAGETNYAEASAVVFALSAWKVDEIEVLRQAYPGTPWLHLYGDHDDTSNPCQQDLSTVPAARFLSRPAKSSEGVVLPSSSLTAAAAARVLTRLFGVKPTPVGELRMAELYASHALAEAESSLDIAGETATVPGYGAPASFSRGGGARPSNEACRKLRKASGKTAQVLGGPFDPTWWWGAQKIERTIFGKEHDEEQGAGTCHDSGVGGAPTCCTSSTGLLAVDADVGGSDAWAGFEHEWRFHGAATGRDGRGTSGSARPQEEARYGTVFDSSPAPAAAARGPPAAEAERGLDPLELGAAALVGGEEVGGEEARRRWQWQRGLRRMVDSESPSWMSSEVYSEPVESFSCPDVPGPGYPSEWPLLDLLGNWNPGNASAVPPRHFLGVCRFDYQTELHKARAYGLSEVPFIVYNVPELDRAVREWSNPAKLAAALDNKLYSIDVSSTNRFLYYGKRTLDRPPGWTPPTWRITDTFGSWLQHALGASGEDVDQPGVEYNLPVSDMYADHPGVASDQPQDQSPDRSSERFRHDESTDESGTSGALVGQGGEGEAVGATPPGSRLHYYLKLSSTLEKPNLFLDRSLPFFVPPASSRKTVDTDYDVRPADGDYTAGKKGRRRKRPRTSRWADKEAGEEYRRERFEERVDGDTTARAGGSEQRGVKQEGDDEEADEGDNIDIFLRNAWATKGIHCRLGMDGVMSDGHYDGSRNMVALLAGKRRWILSNPKNCGHMHMFRKGHPSARHTSADWTDPEVAKQFPNLEKATANEVILRAGEALYVPEHWIHSIVNIGVSAQCNSRSGKSYLYQSIVQECEDSAHAE